MGREACKVAILIQRNTFRMSTSINSNVKLDGIAERFSYYNIENLYSLKKKFQIVHKKKKLR